MVFDLQKASVWKRISAYLFDVILLGIAVVGFAWILSSVTGFDGYSTELETAYSRYAAEYGVTFELSLEEYEAMPQETRAAYDAALEALSADSGAMRAYDMLVNLSLLIISFSFLFAYLLLELVVPLLFGNGQTLGKKIFGVALMRTDGVRVNGVMLFVRTVLGKYTLETMVPVLLVLLIFWGSIGLLGTVMLGAILLLQLVLLCVTRHNALIHDLLAGTAAVDFASQMIFASEEEKIAYQKKASAQTAEHTAY